MSKFIFKDQLDEYKKDLINKKVLTETDGLIGLNTGFEELNKITRGFKNQEYIIIGARPSMGKTSFSIKILINALKENKDKILFLSLEMPKETIISRIISQYKNISLSATLYGEDYDSNINKIEETLLELENSNIYIEDFVEESNNIDNIDKIIDSYEKEKGKIDLIIVDYLQLINYKSSNKNISQNNKIDEISKRLISIKKRKKCPLIALSQLSRDLEKRTDKRPMMSDLRDSGSLEQDADLIIFLYKHDVYLEKTFKSKFTETLDPLIEIQLNKIKNKTKNKVELLISKNRNGPLGSVDIDFIKNTTNFVEINEFIENDQDEIIGDNNITNIDILFDDIYE